MGAVFEAARGERLEPLVVCGLVLGLRPGELAVSQLLDQGATIDEIADLTGDDPITRSKHDRHLVRPVAMVAAERWAMLQGPDLGPSL